MTTIKSTYGKGGAGIATPDHDGVDLATTLRDIADDLATIKAEHEIGVGNALVVDITALRTKFVAMLAKLDADAGVTDTNYASLETPAAITATSIVATANLVAQTNASLADLTAIRTKMLATLAKLDADGGVTDVDYTSLESPAALTAVAATSINDAPTQINALIVDLAAMTTKFVATLAKLDADAGVTDTNYASLETPAAPTAGAITVLKTIKG